MFLRNKYGLRKLGDFTMSEGLGYPLVCKNGVKLDGDGIISKQGNLEVATCCSRGGEALVVFVTWLAKGKWELQKEQHVGFFSS